MRDGARRARAPSANVRRVPPGANRSPRTDKRTAARVTRSVVVATTAEAIAAVAPSVHSAAAAPAVTFRRRSRV